MDKEPLLQSDNEPAPQVYNLLGPGLITGASDDDPSGIATYSQVGAQFGYNVAWTLLISYPLMCAIQLISAQIGRVTGRGLAGNMRRHYPRKYLYLLLGLLAIANIINIGADLGAMGAALKLLVAGPAALYVAGFAIVTVVLQIFVKYDRYVSVLKWLTLSLFAYVGTVFVVHMPWLEVAKSIFWPHITWDSKYLIAIVAIFGTTISPYLFFWQANSEVESEKAKPGPNALKQTPEKAAGEFRRMKYDTYIGMFFSNLVALFIVLTTAATLHAHGLTDIQTSAQAAEALRPIAGDFAYAFFALGIIGTGLLALPVLSGSAAYALGETLRWPVGLAQRPWNGRAFYATIAVATIIGATLNMTTIDPVKALFWSAVLNGVIAAPIMVMVMLIAANKKIMGQYAVAGGLKTLGWTATAVMTLIAAGMIVTL